jgi:hypothetical protein
LPFHPCTEGIVSANSFAIIKGRTEISPKDAGKLLASKDAVTRRKPSWEENESEASAE